MRLAIIAIILVVLAGLGALFFGEQLGISGLGSTNNATCFIGDYHALKPPWLRLCSPPARFCAGPHRQYDPFTKSFLNLVPGQGQCAAALKPDARLPSACARTHSPRAPRSFAQLRPRRDPRRRTLASWRIRLTQSGQGQHGVARVRYPASQTRALRGHEALG